MLDRIDPKKRRKEQRKEIKRQLDTCPYHLLWYWLKMDEKASKGEPDDKTQETPRGG